MRQEVETDRVGKTKSFVWWSGRGREWVQSQKLARCEATQETEDKPHLVSVRESGPFFTFDWNRFIRSSDAIHIHVNNRAS